MLKRGKGGALRGNQPNSSYKRPPVLISVEEQSPADHGELQMIQESANDVEVEEASVTSSVTTLVTRPAATFGQQQPPAQQGQATSSSISKSKSLPSLMNSIVAEESDGDNNSEPSQNSHNQHFMMQQALQRESMKMLQKMRNELINLKNCNLKLQSDNKRMKESNEKLMEVNITYSKTLGDLMDNSKDLTQRRAELSAENEALKKELEQYEMMLKEEDESKNNGDLQ